MSDILIYQTEDGRTQVNLLVQEHTVWLNQSQLAELFDTSVQNIGLHIKNILEDNELDRNSVIKDFFITAADGKQYQVKHYALEMILAVGFRVRSKRGVQFRRWANEVLTGYLEKGFVLDDKRLKESATSAPAKCGFIKKCANCSNSLPTTTPPTKPRRCFSPKRKTN